MLRVAGGDETPPANQKLRAAEREDDQSSYAAPRIARRSDRRQYPLVGRHFFLTWLNVALLPRGVACKAREMRLEAGHGEIHECADLRNSKPTLGGNQVHGHRGVLVLRQKDLQRGLRELLSNVIREKSGDAASFDG
jgi:hypothetical protein